MHVDEANVDRLHGDSSGYDGIERFVRDVCAYSELALPNVRAELRGS